MYNIQTLPDFKSEGKVFLIDSILEAKTIKILDDANAFNPIAKGSETIQLLSKDTVIQDGSTCGFTPMGGANLSQAVLTVKPLKVNEVYCVRDLERIWAKGDLKAGQNYTEMLFQADIADLSAKDVALKIGLMAWLGDTASADLTLKQIDGFIKQIKAGGYIALTGATGATAIATLAKFYAQMPIDQSGAEDFRILIGQDLYNKYVAELAEKNLFNPTTENVLFGTIAKLEVLSELNGGHVVASRLQNLQAGGEMQDIEYKSWYSQDDDNIKVSSRFSLGVQPIYINKIGYAKVAL
jgi:hypothetical protein